MHIELDINEQKADFFLQYLDSLKEGIVEKVVISEKDRPDFMVSSIEEVRRRVEAAEKSGDYQEHDAFWEKIGVK